MFARSVKIRSLLTVVILVAVAGVLIDRLATTAVIATGGNRSVIIELRDDPGAVYKARAERSGRTVSNEELQTYRGTLSTRQDEFLSALTARGINFETRSRIIRNYDGSTAATIPSRYTLVYNGVALVVPESAISTIAAMPQVKKVHNNGLLAPELNKSVEYIRAPRVYGAVAELGPFDNLMRALKDKESTLRSSTPALIGLTRCLAAIQLRPDWVSPRQWQRSTRIRRSSITFR